MHRDTMTPPPCVTCAHRKGARCFHPRVEPSGLLGRDCFYERDKDFKSMACAPEGKLWEPRQSWVDRIIKRVR